MSYKFFGLIVAGICAGAINGLFGAGGGMLLVPLFTWLSALKEQEIFPSSVCVILPISIVSLLSSHPSSTVSVGTIITYMIASAAGGILAGALGRKIPTIWLHRLLGGLILWGGIQYLC